MVLKKKIVDPIGCPATGTVRAVVSWIPNLHVMAISERMKPSSEVIQAHFDGQLTSSQNELSQIVSNTFEFQSFNKFKKKSIMI